VETGLSDVLLRLRPARSERKPSAGAWRARIRGAAPAGCTARQCVGRSSEGWGWVGRGASMLQGGPRRRQIQLFPTCTQHFFKQKALGPALYIKPSRQPQSSDTTHTSHAGTSKVLIPQYKYYKSGTQDKLIDTRRTEAHRAGRSGSMQSSTSSVSSCPDPRM
jgi:hypothetical protein